MNQVRPGVGSCLNISEGVAKAKESGFNLRDERGSLRTADSFSSRGAGQSLSDIPRPNLNLGPATVMPGRTFRSIKAEAEEEGRAPVSYVTASLMSLVLVAFAVFVVLLLMLFDWS